MNDATLPPAFADLAPHLAWALPTTAERLDRRATSDMPALKAFYDALQPRIEDVLIFLKDYPPDEAALEAPVRNLVRLAKAFMDASIAVEVFRAPDEPGVWDYRKLRLDVGYYSQPIT